MDFGNPGLRIRTSVQEILGYLNFSSGAPDPRFLHSLSDLFGWIEKRRADRTSTEGEAAEAGPAWRLLGDMLHYHLGLLRGSSDTFARVEQAEAVLGLVFDRVLDAYREHHRDLLFHQTAEGLFQPLFLGRVCEAVLAEGPPWDQQDRIVRGALLRLNDFLGHRPVAVLETQQKIQPYAHERVRPIPLFVAGAGVAFGPYHDLIDESLKILRRTDPEMLAAAWFDPDLLDELALDPRAYDFDHPANRRPNYHFGQWDPDHLDSQGRYRRFVLQQVTVDAMLRRITSEKGIPREQLLREAAAVLAGTVLMGSGISGDRPEAHDSSVSLATLLPHIAAYRDEFYEQFLARLRGPHARRLREEARRLRQPLGGARQHLNRVLARRRACQLQHVHLAQLFAQMGYAEAASRQARVIPGPAARMKCEIHCRLRGAHLGIDGGRLAEAAAVLPEIEGLLFRAIECGALVDPWNILGFGGQFSLFPAIENSIHDQRVDELIELMGDIFGLCARLEKEDAAAGRTDLEQDVSDRLGKLAAWWDQFATVEVSSVSGISGRESWESAAHVATALRAWHEGGTGAGDIAFWRRHVDRFRSPKAYALVVEALLEQRDLVAAMALLIQWLGQADEVPLVEEDYSFGRLTLRWMRLLWRAGPEKGDKSHSPGHRPEVGRGPEGASHKSDLSPSSGSATGSGCGKVLPPQKCWELTGKFFDYVEANAGVYGDVPRLELGQVPGGAEPPEEQAPDEDGGLFSAAYENVTYRDSTDDGFEGETLEGGENPTDFELAVEGERIVKRLAFWNTMHRLWKLAAAASLDRAVEPRERARGLARWLKRIESNRRPMTRLLREVHRYRIPPPRSDQESLVEYEHRREVKEALSDRIIAACVESGDAARVILATADGAIPAEKLPDWEAAGVEVLRALFRGDAEAAAGAWPRLVSALEGQPLLYIPTARGGDPERVAASQGLQSLLRRLLTYLPRLGLLHQTYRLILTIQTMERNHPAGPGAITEFDRLFDVGYRAVVRCLAASSEGWHAAPAPPGGSDRELVECLETATQPLMAWWLEHSRNIRLSPMEAIAAPKRFEIVRKFVQRYGADWFTQQFMNYGNLRAILLQGVDAYLNSLEEEPEDGPERGLLHDLGDPDSRQEAARVLELILEAVVEHYNEYMDYNSTTTQSDRGEMLYTLLDFLRLLAKHQRVAWNLRPLVTAHEVLVRCGRSEAAELWRGAIVSRTAETADAHLKQLGRLGAKYGMRLASVADRLAERFVRPLAVDRLRALVRPAIEELRSGRPSAAFGQLEEEADHLADESSGVGFDVPAWLEALDEEVDRVQSPDPDEGPSGPGPHVAQVRLSRDQIDQQLERWTEKGDKEEGGEEGMKDEG